jgi:inosine-uridine nucleoside N-ribohydrolase
MVELAGRIDIPVAAGAGRPLVRQLVTATYAPMARTAWEEHSFRSRRPSPSPSLLPNLSGMLRENTPEKLL